MPPIVNLTEVDSEKSWAVARQLSMSIGPVPPVIADALKVLWKAYWDSPDPDNSEITQECFNQARLIERSAKLRAPISSAAAAWFPDTFSEEQPQKNFSRQLLTALRPGLLAVMLGLVYFHRRAIKQCTSDDWAKLSNDLISNLELGYILGENSPALGRAEGMLLGGIRYLAMATFLIKHEKNYQKYRRVVGKKFDMELERSGWGCDHAQVAAYLIHDLGFYKSLVQSAAALRKFGRETLNLPEELQVWRSALVFLDNLKLGICPPPENSHAAILQISSPQVFETLKARWNNIVENGSSFAWMLKTSKSEM